MQTLMQEKKIKPKRWPFEKMNREIFSKSDLNKRHRITKIGSRNTKPK